MADKETLTEEDTTPTDARLKVQDAAPAPEPLREPHVLDAVHYVYNGLHVASTIYEVFEDGTVRLQATDGSFAASPIAQDTSGAEGTFHYPEE